MSPQTGGGGNGCLYALLGLGALMVVAGLALSSLPELGRMLAERTSAAQDPPTAAQPTGEWLPPADPEPARDRPDESQDPLDRALAADAVPPQPAQSQAAVTLLWHAQTREAPPVSCVLAVDARELLGGRFATATVRLRCADGRALSGSPMHSALFAMRTERGVAFRAQAADVDVEARDGTRAVLSFDTRRHELALHAPTAAPLAMFVEELSAAHPELAPLGPRTPIVERIVRLAVPTHVSGELPPAVTTVRGTGPRPRRGDPVCELTVDPTFTAPFTCRVVLRCDGQIIYGAGTSGLNRCAVQAGRPITADDGGSTPEDGDPRVRFDINADTLVVSDTTERDGAWSATFDLRPDPRCGHGAYVGRARGRPSDASFSIGPFADSPSYQIADAVVPLAAVSARCGSAELEVQDNTQQRSWLSFGPGASSVAGYVGSPPRAVWGFRR